MVRRYKEWCKGRVGRRTDLVLDANPKDGTTIPIQLAAHDPRVRVEDAISAKDAVRATTYVTRHRQTDAVA